MDTFEMFCEVGFKCELISTYLTNKYTIFSTFSIFTHSYRGLEISNIIYWQSLFLPKRRLNALMLLAMFRFMAKYPQDYVVRAAEFIL